MDEYSRILSNPENFIVSDELRDRIEGAPEDNKIGAKLFFSDIVNECDLISYSRYSDGVKLVLGIAALDLVNLVKAKNISCEVCDEVFEFGRCFEFDNTASTSILTLDTRLSRNNYGKRIL